MESQTTMTTEFKAGDRVNIVGERGVYTVQNDQPNKDGSITLYGGDVNPNGNRGSRYIMPKRLRPVKVKKGGR
jgi:hypothetical protein